MELYPIVLSAQAWGHQWHLLKVRMFRAVMDCIVSGTSRCPHIMHLPAMSLPSVTLLPMLSPISACRNFAPLPPPQHCTLPLSPRVCPSNTYESLSSRVPRHLHPFLLLVSIPFVHGLCRPIPLPSGLWPAPTRIRRHPDALHNLPLRNLEITCMVSATSTYNTGTRTPSSMPPTFNAYCGNQAGQRRLPRLPPSHHSQYPPLLCSSTTHQLPQPLHALGSPTNCLLWLPP